MLKTYSPVKIPIETITYRGPDAEFVALQKLELQRRFKEVFGIKLWKPRPGGGTYMDGRCAKLAFGNPEKFSEMIGNLQNKAHLLR